MEAATAFLVPPLPPSIPSTPNPPVKRGRGRPPKSQPSTPANNGGSTSHVTITGEGSSSKSAKKEKNGLPFSLAQTTVFSSLALTFPSDDAAGIGPVPRSTLPNPPHASLNPSRLSQKQTKAPEVPMSSLRTESPIPRGYDEASRKERIFGLERGPTFYPTAEEWADPMAYIQRLAKPVGEEGGLGAAEYGIAKIVPPQGWQMTWDMDTEVFRFKTRVQTLNSMEACARANLNFMEQLYIFHKQQDKSPHSKITVPQINHRPVDLWRLRKEVHSQGGYQAITQARKWPSVAKSLGYDVRNVPSVSSQLKTAFQRIILPFDEFMANSASSSSATSTNPSITPKPAARSNLIVKEESLETPKVMERVKEATKRLEEALNTESGMEVEEEVPPGELCEVCGTDDRPEAILLCDGCERGWHLDCLTPPLKSVPKSPSWLCDGCLRVIGGDYGFDEGQTHSLYSFKKRADRFRELWLARHPVKHTREGEVERELAMEDHLEREFWRLVESPSETVEVEYGADIHASKYGSGLPGLEKDPTNPYARDGWNLNNLPILPGSLLRYIKSDVSGMTVPWVYVGMLFSTFAWHKEDHYTYSINFQSWGATKTWYGVPGHQDELLDSAMKAAAPELFQQQPDLLFQLVTLMSPGRLKKAGVKVYAVDQRPNEFVITFPKAYHAGFNQGLNYNTAVNFALPDWLDKGLECVMAYKELSKPPVFCHDELLVTISVHDKTAGTSKWLLPAYREMVDREVRRRNVLREELPEIEEDVDSQDVADGEYQCSRCQGMYYLSQVIHRPSARITCLEHHSSLPKEGTKALRLRFADEELRRMLGRVRSRSEGGRGGGGVLFDGGEVRKSKRERKPSRALLEAQGLDGSSSEDGEGELPIEMSRKRAREEPIQEAENEETVDYSAPSVTTSAVHLPVWEESKPMLPRTSSFPHASTSAYVWPPLPTPVPPSEASSSRPSTPSVSSRSNTRTLPPNPNPTPGSIKRPRSRSSHASMRRGSFTSESSKKSRKNSRPNNGELRKGSFARDGRSESVVSSDAGGGGKATASPKRRSTNNSWSAGWSEVSFMSESGSCGGV